LPWAHSFGHTAELHLLVSIGASTGICESTDKIVQYLSEVKPTVLFAVPRIFNRIYSGVEKQMESRPAPIRALFRGGLKAAAKKRHNKPLSMGEKLTLFVADKLVFSKVRARFGGNLKYAISGAAALAHEVAEFVDGLGITVYEGYGLTETSPIVSVNMPGRRKLGSVGQPIDGVRVVIDKTVTNDPKNGEIIVYGPNVMQGYYNHKAETDAVFTADGGFRTGDMGYLDEDNYLFITGRIKEQYKLENGKYVVPAPLEEALKLSPFVSNVMIYGDNKPFNVALVAANVESVKEWAKAHGVGEKKVDDLLADDRVRAKVKEELDRLSGEFKGYERIRSFALISEDFTQENGMLTPKLSVKRRNVMQKWGAELEKLYR
jgi:long-chain acyl-CoA synthetase